MLSLQLFAAGISHGGLTMLLSTEYGSTICESLVYFGRGGGEGGDLLGQAATRTNPGAAGYLPD